MRDVSEIPSESEGEGSEQSSRSKKSSTMHSPGRGQVYYSAVETGKDWHSLHSEQQEVAGGVGTPGPGHLH